MGVVAPGLTMWPVWTPTVWNNTVVWFQSLCLQTGYHLIVEKSHKLSSVPKGAVAISVLFTFEELTADWLNRILRDLGVLIDGKVIGIKLSRTAHQASLNYFLDVEYSPTRQSPRRKRSF